MNKLILRGSSGELLNKHEPRYLLNKNNGRVLFWQPILAVDKKYVDCDIDGNEIGSPQGDDPFLRAETNRVAEQMYQAGATADTVADYGKQLASRGAEKFKALESNGAYQGALESDQHKIDEDDPYHWVYEQIEESARCAISEIDYMTLKALHKIAGNDIGFVRPPTEVSFQWQIEKVKAQIKYG